MIWIKKINVWELLKAWWVIMISVYDKDRELNREVLVHVVGVSVLVSVEFDVLFSKHIAIHHLLQLIPKHNLIQY